MPTAPGLWLSQGPRKATAVTKRATLIAKAQRLIAAGKSRPRVKPSSLGNWLTVAIGQT